MQFFKINSSKKGLTLIAVLLLLSSMFANAQTAKWQDKSNNKNVSFYQVQQDFYNYWQGKRIEKGKGYKPFKRWEAFMAPRVYPSGNMALPSTTYTNFLNWQQDNANRPISTLSTGNWTELGPIGSPSGPSPYSRTGAGRLNFVRFDPNNSNTMWVGAPDGGLWKSTNGGASWATNTDFLTIIGCSDLCIDPINTQIMYLASGDIENDRNSIGVLKSTDGGATWNTTGANWPSSNGWKISKLLMNPSNSLNMIMATNVGIFHTTDGWVTSNFQQAGNFKDMEFKPGDPSTLYAAGTQVWKSTNNGVTWAQVTTGLPSSNVSRIALGVTAGNDAYVYALIGKASDQGYLGMYRSINSGTSFSLRSSTPNLLGYNTNGLDAGGQAFYDLAVIVSPTNAELVTTGGVNHWQSADGGTTWTNLSFWASGEVHADVHELNYLPGSSTTMFSCNDGGIFKSTDNGDNFVDISNNLAIGQVVGIGLSANVATTVVNGEQDNGTNLKTGSNWANINGGDGGECMIDPTNNNTIYIQYVQGAFSRSDNGGASNTAITTGLPGGFDFYSEWIIDPVNSSRLYVGGVETLYTSANKGDLWTALGTPTGSGSIKGIAVAPSNTTIIYTVKEDAISRSTNSGATFSDITGTLPVGSAALTSVTVSNTDPDKVWVTFSGYSAGNKVFKSINGGTTWTNVSAGLPNLPVNIVVYTNNTLNDAIYVGADIGVYYLDNSLAAFAPFMTSLPNVAVRDLEIFYPTGKLRAGTYGRGVWESDINTTTIFALTASCAGTNNTCNAGTSGSAAVTVLTGNAPYTYLWSNGSTNASLTGLAAGVYSITVTDATLATATCSYSVTQPIPIVANCSGTNATTNGGSDGTASVAPASGGTSTATFTSTNTFTGAPFTSVGPIATVSTITVPALPAGAVINSATLNLTNVNAINGSFQSEVRVSLTGAYTLAATQLNAINSGGLISPNPSINLAGFPTAGGVVNLRLSESFDDVGVNDATVGGAEITINYTLNGYTYLWSNGNTTTGITGLVAGTYTVTITDAIGCTNTCAYTVTQPGGSFNITSSAGANGTITPNGITSVTSGANQTYNIAANACYAIADVLVDGVSQGAIGTYTFTNVTAAHTISASFSLLIYNITSSAGANGSISPNGTTSVNCGDNQTYTITANSCFVIADVLVDGVSQGAIGTYTFTNVTAAHTISATFSQLTYNITAGAGANGSISPNGVTSVNCGASQAYTITPDGGYNVQDVLVDGVSQGAITTYTFTNVTAAHTISATFVSGAFTITASTGANGIISPSGAVSVASGANQTFTITANSCYVIADVLVDGVSQGAIGTYTFTNVTAAHTISATFSQLTFNITSSAGANGSITPNGVTAVNCAASQAYTFAANTCYQIATVLIDGVNDPVAVSSGTYTFSNVTAAHTISVTFSQLTYNITSSAGANGSISPIGVTSVNCGDNQTYNITADGGYDIQNVVVDGVSQGAIPTYTFNNVTTTHTINASFVLSGGGCDVTGSGTTTPVLCFGNSNGTATITLTGAGSGAPGTYTVDGGGSQPYTTNPFTITGLTAGNHTIVATVTAGSCVSSNILVNVGTPATFTASFTKTNLSACNGSPDGTITITPAGGTAPYTYLWSGVTGSNQNPFTAGNVSSLTGLNYGYYNVTVTDAGGCAVVVLSNIHIQFAFTTIVTNSGSTTSACGNNGSILLYGNAGVLPYTYSIDGTNYQASNLFTGLAAGTYTGYIKDAAGCVGTKPNIVIAAAAPIVVNPFVRNASSCGNDGSIEVYRSGGISPYSYSLDDITYQTSNVFSGLAAGSYTAYVKDSKGCVGSQTATVGQGAALSLSPVVTNTSTCINDGTVRVTVSGGVAPYTYSKDGTTYQSSNLFAGLAAGSYTIYAKDSKGCTGTVNVTINLNTISVTAYAVAASSCSNPNGSIQLFRTGGVGPYTYSLDGNTYQSSTVFSNLPAATYTGYVKDSKGCIGQLEGIVVGPTNCAPPVANNSKGIVATVEAPVVSSLKVEAYPNPSEQEFKLVFNGFNSREKVFITVTDLLGRRVYQTAGIGKLQYTFGNNFKPGMYSVQVLQGNKSKVLKLVKE